MNACDMVNACFRHQHPEAFGRQPVVQDYWEQCSEERWDRTSATFNSEYLYVERNPWR